MEVKIDSAGRVVIPKVLRESLGVSADDKFEVTPDGAGLRLEPVQRQSRQVAEQDGLPLIEAVPGLRTTDEDIRRIRHEAQR